MKEALYYEKLKDKVQCYLCPHNCVITKGKRGNCGVRENKDNKLYSLVYGKACSATIDPIEKKPLYHFIPGHSSFSVATVGCNLHCLHCQNWEISQPEAITGEDLPPEEVVRLASAKGCKSIAYTYTEPTIYFEYALETAKLARKKGIKNVIVSNGFINEEPLNELCKYLDGANIDLKGFTEDFYKKVCCAKLEPVLNSLKILKEKGVWLEITNLIIPTLNDDMKKIGEMCKWIKDNLGTNIPLHFSRFFPYYKLNNINPTSAEMLVKARDIARKVGINYVYIGNIFIEGADNTYCPKCGELMIERVGFQILQNNIKGGKCSCGEKIAGVWE
jgi:pyruvate formate lyase activating enzyme